MLAVMVYKWIHPQSHSHLNFNRPSVCLQSSIVSLLAYTRVRIHLMLEEFLWFFFQRSSHFLSFLRFFLDSQWDPLERDQTIKYPKQLKGYDVVRVLNQTYTSCDCDIRVEIVERETEMTITFVIQEFNGSKIHMMMEFEEGVFGNIALNGDY